MDVDSNLSYHLLASFVCRIYHDVEGSNFNVMDVTDCIPSHMRRGFEEEKLVHRLCLLFLEQS